MELDFSQEFQRLDVMTELGLCPSELEDMDKLRPKLVDMLHPFLPKVASTLNDK